MKKSNMIKNCITLFSALVISIITAGCTQIGLGTAVDIQAPVVSIISPETLSSVSQTVKVSGTARDNQKLSCIKVSVAETEQVYILNDSKWSRVFDGDYVEIEEGYFEGDSKNISWSIPVFISGAKSGNSYTIVAQAFDEAGNEGKNSKTETTVIVDTVEPSVSVNTPVLVSMKDAQEKADSYNLKDYNVLSSLINGNFVISGSQKEDVALEKLIIFIDDEMSDEIISEPSEFIKKFELNSDNLRNWSISLDGNDFPENFQSGKKILRVVTESFDKAGNVELKVQGMFIYCKEADVPWIEAAFGDDKQINSSENINKQKEVYPGCTLQGHAYDDDGLKSISVTLNKEVNDVYVKDEEQSFLINLEEKETSYYTWSLCAPSETCQFNVCVSCTDIYGTVSENVIRYMNVSDVNPPELSIEKINCEREINNGDSLLSICDADGNFTFEGYVSDDGNVDSLKVVRIKKGNEENQIDYYNSSYDGWNKACNNGTVLDNGDKVWNIELSEEMEKSSSGGKSRKSFSKVFNIFSDLGIDGNTEKLSSQNFIFLVKDSSGESSVEPFTLQGDDDVPVLSINEIYVYESNGELKEKKNFTSYETPTLQAFAKEDNSVTDRIVLSGTWSDNSQNCFTKDVTDNISLIWKDADSSEIFVEKKSDGTWITEKIIPPDSSSAVITVSMSDWAGNSAKCSESFFVNNSVPEFKRISSLNSDGSYKAGDSIVITMEFNKNITFSGGSGSPELVLNNGRKASYKSGNGSSRHCFEYIVVSGDDKNIDKLDVSSINTNENIWKDDNDAEINSSSFTKLPEGVNSLSGGRSIYVDTSSPSLKSVSFITADGNYKKGKELFIQAEFTESVSFLNSDVDILSLGLELDNGVQYTDSASRISDTKVLFRYTVKENDTAENLKVKSFCLNECKISDRAGNYVTSEKVPYNSSSINIDTSCPCKPFIGGVENGKLYYSEKSIYISGFEDSENTVKKYSLDGGNSWNDYSGSFKISSAGVYNITAYQEDAAGNRSDDAELVTITLDPGTVITSVSSGAADGTYTTNQSLSIYLNFRKNVYTDSDAFVTLNAVNLNKKDSDEYIKKTAHYVSGNGTKKLLFTYTVADGDCCSSPLDVTGFTGTITDDSGNDISEYVDISLLEDTKNLSASRSIYVVTSVPEVTDILFTEENNVVLLKIYFSSAINRYNGNILIEQQESGYLAPAVLSKSEYDDIKDYVSSFYEKGTNGSGETGASDLTEKYTLKYSYSTDDSSLVSAMKAAGVLKTYIPVDSSQNYIENGNVFVVPLKNSFALPVKGAEYLITIPAGLVIDNLNNSSKEFSSSLVLPGVEEPVIRINKCAETLKENSQPVQPLTANVKIDCQTPGAKIYYVADQNASSQKTLGRNYLPEYGSGTVMPQDTSSDHKSMPDFTKSKLYSSAFTIGSSTDVVNGYKVLIMAKASTTQNEKQVWSDPSFESAYRSVVTLWFRANRKRFNYMWIRGGDATSGGVSTPGFPFSWDTSEYDMARGMTNLNDQWYDGEKYSCWYWVTWNLNTTAYVGFVNGNMPSDCAENGPSQWFWLSCSWTALKEYYPVYQGESILLQGLASYDRFLGVSRSPLDVQDKHFEQRSETGTWSASIRTYNETNWIWNDNCTVFAKVTFNDNSSKWIQCNGYNGTNTNYSSIFVELPQNASSLYCVRCSSETTLSNVSSAQKYNTSSRVYLNSSTKNYYIGW